MTLDLVAILGLIPHYTSSFQHASPYALVHIVCYNNVPFGLLWYNFVPLKNWFIFILLQALEVINEVGDLLKLKYSRMEIPQWCEDDRNANHLVQH